MNIMIRLKTLSFLQFFIWGCWLITLGSYMIKTLHFSGSDVGWVYSSLGIASVFMPAPLGMLADKYIPANRLFAFCHIICAISLYYAASATTVNEMFWIMLINSLAFMPTLSLSNSISYYCLDKYKLDSVAKFPPIRACGTIGFILAMWTISLLHLELSNQQLYIAAASSLLLALYALTLPTVETSKSSTKMSLVSKLGLDAFALFNSSKMAIFFLFAMLLGAVLQITNTFGNPFLHDFSENPVYKGSLVVEYPAILLSLSQISEFAFILTIPFFLKRFGIRIIMLISMLAWTLRFGLFAFGDPSPVGCVLLMLSMIIYGCAFDFFNISGSVFIEKEVPPKIRASAQGLFMTMVNGFGLYFGMLFSGEVVDYFTIEGVKNWHSIWLVFAGYSLALAILFYFIYPDKNKESKKAS